LGRGGGGEAFPSIEKTFIERKNRPRKGCLLTGLLVKKQFSITIFFSS
jgi:hypothetical protein